MSTLGLFWICSVVIAYGVGMGIGIYLYKPKKTKNRPKPGQKPGTFQNAQGKQRRIY